MKMAVFRALFAVLFVGAYVCFIAIRYWAPIAAPPACTEHHEVGIAIPSIGLGTWLSDEDKVAHAVEFALNSGYNHIDAALIYSLSTPIRQAEYAKLTSPRK